MATRTQVVVNTRLAARDATSPALRRMARSARATRAAMGSLANGLKTIAIVGAGAGVAFAGIAAGLSRIAASTAQRGDEFGKLARQVGISAEKLQEMEFIAGRQGATFENITTGVTAFTKRLGEARAGTGSLRTYLQRSNPALLEQLLAFEDNGEALEHFIEVLAETTSEQDAMALASAAFSRGAGADYLRFVDGGIESLKALIEEQRRFRPALTPEQIRNAEQYEDSVFNLKQSALSLRDALGAKLIPVFSEMAQNAANWVANNRELINQKIHEWAAKFVASISQINWQGVADSAISFANAIAGIDWPTVVAGFSNVAAGIGAVVGFLSQAIQYTDELIALWLGSKLIRAGMAFRNAVGGGGNIRSASRAGLGAGGFAAGAAGGGILQKFGRAAISRISAGVVRALPILLTVTPTRMGDGELRSNVNGNGPSDGAAEMNLGAAYKQYGASRIAQKAQEAANEILEKALAAHAEEYAPVRGRAIGPGSGFMTPTTPVGMTRNEGIAAAIARLEGALKIRIDVRAEGATVQSIETSNGNGLVGRVQTNMPGYGGVGPR